MRPSPFRFALVACLAAAVAAPAVAQFGFGFKPKVSIENPRVGFPTAGGGEKDGTAPRPVSKAGMWAPVSFSLEVLRENDRGMRLEVTTADGDGIRTISSVPIRRKIDTKVGEVPPAKGTRIEPTEFLNTSYVRVGGDSGTVRLQIVADDDSRDPLSDPLTVDLPRERPVSRYVILSLGTSVPGLTFPNPDKGAPPGVAYLRNGRIELAKIESVQEMPDQWFGYEAADLVVLGTGKADKQFIADLFTGTTAMANRKRWALFEWVRRGGKLIVSVADRSEEVRTSPTFADILPVTVGQVGRIEKLKTVPFPGGRFGFEMRFPLPKKEDQKPDLLPVATFTPKEGKPAPTVLLTEDTSVGKPRILVAQSALGLGRVTAVAFDLDRSPFADNLNRADFWDWLVKSAGSELAAEAVQKAGQNNKVTSYSTVGPEDGVAAALRGNVDGFEGVPVISFGWVALFILGYTLLIGPVEYLFLKKVLGKLELTWVTFPLIVLTVSAAAYFTAYAVKGKDLRVNKIDVVDVDLHGDGRVYGRTWFTIFSPRIDSYTIGVAPKENWAKQPPEGPVPATVTDWFGITTGSGVGGSGRSYKYEIDPLNDDGRPTGPANGLVGVPIQVWSTKAFTANWSGVPSDPQLPPVTSDVARMANSPTDVMGKITINLPLKGVQEAYAVYGKRVYELDSGIATGLPVPFSTRTNKVVTDQSSTPLKVDDRFYTADKQDDMYSGRNRGRVQQTTAPTANTPLPLWGVLFHEAATQGQGLQNATLRGLDQSWRLTEKNTDEVIVLIRLKRVNDDIEALVSAADSASPTTLWLKGLPGSGPRPPVEGKLQQDTYLRFYFPVKPAGGR